MNQEILCTRSVFSMEEHGSGECKYNTTCIYSGPCPFLELMKGDKSMIGVGLRVKRGNISDLDKYAKLRNLGEFAYHYSGEVILSRELGYLFSGAGIALIAEVDEAVTGLMLLSKGSDGSAYVQSVMVLKSDNAPEVYSELLDVAEEVCIAERIKVINFAGGKTGAEDYEFITAKGYTGFAADGVFNYSKVISN